MYLQEILEVAIGLISVWLVISVATMSIQEWISSIVNLRANSMEKVIKQMLGSEDLTQQFYAHPLIASLYPQPKKPNKKPRLPSYIPANKFSSALFDLILQAGTENSPVRAMTDQVEQHVVSIGSPEQEQLAREDWDAILETADNVTASGRGSAALDSLKFQVQAYGDKYPELKPDLDMLIPQLDAYYGQVVEEQRSAMGSGANAGPP